MGEIRDMIQKTYAKKGEDLPGAKGHPITEGAKPPKPIPVKRPRSVGDISIAIKAQQIYNPGAPPAPPMKAPNKAQLDRGTADAMNLDTSFLGKK